MSRRNPWAYHVTPAQWRRDVVENEAIIAQLEACTTAGIEPLDAEGTEPQLLAFWDRDQARRMGLDDGQLAALVWYIDLEQERDWHKELPPPGADAYAVGKKLCADLQVRFGRHVWPSAQRPRLRADAKRRLRKAKKSLGER